MNVFLTFNLLEHNEFPFIQDFFEVRDWFAYYHLNLPITNRC